MCCEGQFPASQSSLRVGRVGAGHGRRDQSGSSECQLSQLQLCHSIVTCGFAIVEYCGVMWSLQRNTGNTVTEPHAFLQMSMSGPMLVLIPVLFRRYQRFKMHGKLLTGGISTCQHYTWPEGKIEVGAVEVDHYARNTQVSNPEAVALRQAIQQQLKKERAKWGDKGGPRWNRAAQEASPLISEVGPEYAA